MRALRARRVSPARRRQGYHPADASRPCARSRRPQAHPSSDGTLCTRARGPRSPRIGSRRGYRNRRRHTSRPHSIRGCAGRAGKANRSLGPSTLHRNGACSALPGARHRDAKRHATTDSLRARRRGPSQRRGRHREKIARFGYRRRWRWETDRFAGQHIRSRTGRDP